MNFENIFDMTVEDWEDHFSNRSNTREISHHGGGTRLSYFMEGVWWQTFSPEEMLAVYPNMVQAALNMWFEWALIERDPFESCPVADIARMAFDREGQIYEHLRPFFNRLWHESPRPHGKQLLYIALNSSGEIPVSRAELGLLYELDGWAFVAARTAFQKGWSNDAIAMFGSLEETKLSIFSIENFVGMGLSKEKGIFLLQKFYPSSEYAQLLISKWNVADE